MKKRIILILLSDPNSISEKIVLNSLDYLKRKKNIYLLLGDLFFFKKLAKKTYVINKIEDINKKKINFYNICSGNISLNKYINLATDLSINLLKQKKISGLINMPLNKIILGKNIPGYTEFFAKKLHESGKENMLLFSNNLAVCPLTTHLPIKNVAKNINKKKIYQAVKNINFFFKRFIKKNPKIKICGLNPHAGKDLIYKNNEEKKIIIPSIKNLRIKNKNVSGPHSTDTVFLNYKNNVIIGMFHDQVITPFKTIKKFNAINITIGLKYLRVSPDHGTGLDIFKKKINIQSFKNCIKFYENYFNV